MCTLAVRVQWGWAWGVAGQGRLPAPIPWSWDLMDEQALTRQRREGEHSRKRQAWWGMVQVGENEVRCSYAIQILRGRAENQDI